METPTSASNHTCAEPFEIWRARKFILENFEGPVSLGSAARAVNINSNHLSEKFKRVTGTNFVSYVTRVRTEKACALLRDTNLRISEIAFAVGFQSLSQFNRAFKKVTGQAPREFRASPRL